MPVKDPMLKFFSLLSLLALCAHTSAPAQENRITIAPEYNAPIGKLSWSYRASPGIQLKYSRFNNDDYGFRKGMAISLGYTALQPIADTLYYIVDRGGVDGAAMGRAAYSPYRILQLTFALAYELDISKNVFADFGFGAAFYYGDRVIYFEDDFGAVDGADELITRGAFIPRAGLGFRINKNFSVIPYVSYHLMIEIGSTDPDALNYNANTGLMTHFYTSGLSLNFAF